MTRGGFTFAHAAPHLHRDAGFDGRGDGHIHAKPLYWRPGGAANGLPIVATEPTVVQALDATGHTVWRSALPCGNIDPPGLHWDTGDRPRGARSVRAEDVPGM